MATLVKDDISIEWVNIVDELSLSKGVEYSIQNVTPYPLEIREDNSTPLVSDFGNVLIPNAFIQITVSDDDIYIRNQKNDVNKLGRIAVFVTGGADITILNVTEVNTPSYIVQDTDNIIHVTYTLIGVVTITLPTSDLSRTGALIIKDASFNASINNITIQTEGSEKIDGDDTAVISSDETSVSLYTDGTDWFIY